MTEHSAVIFVFFFLAEYASIVLICIFTTILFLGGYLKIFSVDAFFNVSFLLDIIYFDAGYSTPETEVNFLKVFFDGLVSSLMLGFKSCIMIFVFIWARASLPRIRFDQLMSYCWTILLPIVIAFIILVPCIVYSLSLIPSNFYLI